MFKKIAVPLDGSELSEKALPYALKLANFLQAGLTLVRVVEVPGLPAVSLRTKYLDEAAAYLMNIKSFLITNRNKLQILPDQIDVRVVFGDPASEICRLVKEQELILPVMTTHGRSGFSHFLMGSVAEKVLHKLSIPILLIRPFGEQSTHTLQELLTAQDEPYAKTFLENGVQILVPLDQNEKAEMALPTAFELARALNASLNLIKVNLPVENMIYSEAGAFALSAEVIEKREEQEKLAAEVYLGEVKKLAYKEGVTTLTQVLIGDPAEEIMRYADTVQPDLIIIATHARGELGRLIFGSVANQILQTTRLTIMMVPMENPSFRAIAATQTNTHSRL
jgi:nucleotide-binding universal stress UspA family protein